LSINRKQREIEACKSGKVAIVAKSKNLSKKIMANYMCRMTQMQIGRGFFTWLENTRETNQEKRTVKKVMLFMHRNQVHRAFRTWVDNHHGTIQGELDMNLHDTAASKRELLKAGDEASKQ